MQSPLHAKPYTFPLLAAVVGTNRRHVNNYACDIEHEEDYAFGWLWPEVDPGASYGPFTGTPQTSYHLPEATPPPEAFFNLLFDEFMWDKLTMETNIYASTKNSGKFLTYFLFSIFYVLFSMNIVSQQEL